MRRVVIYTPRRKILGTIAAGLIMTAASAFVAFAPLEVYARVVGYLGMTLFGGGTVVYLLISLRPIPVLVLDAEGLEIRRSAFGTARLAWDDVDHLVVRRVYGQRMLGIVPREAERWLAAHSPAAEVLARANRSLGAPFWIAESTLQGTCADLARLIQNYRPVQVVELD